jgi:hypothetical protein
MNPLHLSLIRLHDPNLPKPLHNVPVHTTQPLLAKPFFTARALNRHLQVLAHKRDEIDLVHRVGVDEFTLARVFGGFGVGWVVGFWGPVEGTEKGAALACRTVLKGIFGFSEGKGGNIYVLDTPIIHAI